MSYTDETIHEIIKDCFWGDYNYTVDDIKKQLDSGSERFKSFLFGKIINNSIYPSKYLKSLFTIEEVKHYLSNDTGYNRVYMSRRIELIRANLLGESIQIKGLSWKIK